MRYIVVDDKNRPMSFDGDQFYYVGSFKTTSKRKTFPFPLKSYSKPDALILIDEHTHYREQRGWSETKLYIMPILTV